MINAELLRLLSVFGLSYLCPTALSKYILNDFTLIYKLIFVGHQSILSPRTDRLQLISCSIGVLVVGICE